MKKTLVVTLDNDEHVSIDDGRILLARSKNNVNRVVFYADEKIKIRRAKGTIPFESKEIKKEEK